MTPHSDHREANRRHRLKPWRRRWRTGVGAAADNIQNLYSHFQISTFFCTLPSSTRKKKISHHIILLQLLGVEEVWPPTWYAHILFPSFLSTPVQVGEGTQGVEADLVQLFLVLALRDILEKLHTCLSGCVKTVLWTRVGGQAPQMWVLFEAGSDLSSQLPPDVGSDWLCFMWQIWDNYKLVELQISIWQSSLLERASKEKDKNSEPCGRKGKRQLGADLAPGKQLGWAPVLHGLSISSQICSPRSQLPTTPSTLQMSLFVCYHPHTFLYVLFWWLFCSFSALCGSFLLWPEEHLDANVKPEILTHRECWLNQ